MWFQFIIFLLTYFIIDMLWIQLSSKYHKASIERVQNSPLHINMISGSLYYLIVSFLVIYILSKFTNGSTSSWFQLGFLLTLLMFVTFDLTNKTIFTNYPYRYALFDIVGGITSVMLSLGITMGITGLLV